MRQMRQMRLETDEAFDSNRTTQPPYLSLDFTAGGCILRFVRRNKLHCFTVQSRAASGGGANPIARRIRAARVATSRVERALSSSRLRSIRELGARERPCGARLNGAYAGQKSMADQRRARRRRD